MLNPQTLAHVPRIAPATIAGSAWQVHDGDRRAVAGMVADMPPEWAHTLSAKYNDVQTEQGRQAANLALLQVREIVRGVSLSLATDDNALRDRARSNARVCGVRTPQRARQFVLDLGIDPAQAETERGEYERYKCEQWWRRKLRAKHGREIERAAIHANIVNSKNQIYASDTTVKHRRTQNERNRGILAELEAVNELGDAFTLEELSARTVSNPAIRRAELMTRIRGFEEVAGSLGHVGEFYTVTCPSRMHSTHKKNGRRNPKYDGTTPRQAQKYLCRVWARIRAALHRRKIELYGFRVAEPQHDGTPHWHMLFFMPAGQKKLVRNLTEQYARGIVKPHWYYEHRANYRARGWCIRKGSGVCWLENNGGERGAKKYRFEAIAIDPAKGTAAGYIAKYIAKNIDGYAIDADLFGNDPKQAAARVSAWAARWGIRQFQQIGGPSVTTWRELRRVKEAPAGVLEDARAAADAGEWMQYIKIMGGPVIPRDMRPIQLMKAGPVDYETGEIKLNKYGEPAADQIKGVSAGNVDLPTRFYEWTISKKGASDGVVHKQDQAGNDHRGNVVEYGVSEYTGCNVAPDGAGRIEQGGSDYVCIRGGAASSGEAGEKWELDCFDLSGATAPPWTRVNNCTQEGECLNGTNDGDGEKQSGKSVFMGWQGPD